MKSLLIGMTLVLSLHSTFATASAREDVLSDFARFRKLSLILRGRAPTPSEIAKIQALQPSQRNQLFNQLAAEYMTTEEFNQTFVAFLSDTMRVARPELAGNFRSPTYTSLHLKFYDLIKNDRSWDDLLTSKRITLSLIDLNNGRNSPNFYSSVLSTEQIQTLRKHFEASFKLGVDENVQFNGQPFPDINVANISRDLETDSNNLAGVLTDPAFLNRHPTTPINQNRKRTSAVFRIFLCDDMKAVILPDANAERELELAALDDGAASRANIPTAPDIVKMHANDEKCSSCHYKLDPMGNAFKGISSKLSGRSVPGSLVFKRKSGELVKIPFANINELAQAIVKQPEYASCQVKHLWNFVIGKDLPMSSTVESELVKKFNASGRKPKLIISQLLQRPEFTRIPRFTVDNIDFQQVSGILNNCKSCHDSNMLAPNVSTLPFSRFGFGHQTLINEMIHELDLLGNGARASMPPKSAGWKLEAGERNLLSAWIAGGAKEASDDGAGKETYSNTLLRDKLREKLKNENADFSLRPSFDYTAKRRMTPQQIQQTFKALADDFGLENMTFWDFRLDDLRTRNLENGEVLALPPASFGSNIAEVVARISSRGPWVKRFEKFGLQLPKRPDNAYVEVANSPANQFGPNMEVFLKIHSIIYGYEPQPGSPTYVSMENFVRRGIKNPTVDFEQRVKSYFTQLILLNKYLTY